MKTYAIFICTLLLGIVSSSMAHEIHHKVTYGEATIVEVFFSHDKPFANRSYEIFRAGEEVPYQTGQSDDLGRIVFIPDRAGTWRIRAFSKDGHGIDLSIHIESPGEPLQIDRAVLKPLEKIFIGIAILFGFFGIISLIYGGRKARRGTPE